MPKNLHAVNRKLQTLATEDGLTGLKNHRAFQERLALEYAHAPRYDVPLSICLLDVDKFKQYNDTFGHPAGDVVLKQVADVISRNIRETDFIARYGGEEFVLILPHTDTDGAYTVAERCRDRRSRAKSGRSVPSRRPSASPLCTRASQAAPHLVAVADKALVRREVHGPEPRRAFRRPARRSPSRLTRSICPGRNS